LRSVAGIGNQIANDIKSEVREQLCYFGYDEDCPM